MPGSKRLEFPFVCELCTGLRAKLDAPQWLGCSYFLCPIFHPWNLGGGLCCHYILRMILEKSKQLMNLAMCGSQEERGLRYRKIKVQETNC